MNRFSRPLFLWLEPALTRFESHSGHPHPDRIPESIGVAEWLVIGMGRTGLSAYLALHAQEKRVVGFDSDPTVLENLLADGRRVVYGDAEDPELWTGLPLERVKGIILTLPEFDIRASAVIQLRNAGFQGQIGTLCYYHEEQQELNNLGANFVIHPLIEAGNQIVRQMLETTQDLTSENTGHISKG